MPDKYNQIGIHCPNCHDTRSDVAMTRSHDGKTFRRRKCKTCKSLFTTVEQYVVGAMKAAVFANQDARNDPSAKPTNPN